MHPLFLPQQIWGVPASSSSYTYNTISAEDAAAMKEQADAIVDAGTWSWPSNGPSCPACVGR